MLGLESRAAKAAWTVFLVGLLLVLVYYIRLTLLVFILSILFSYLLAPLVNLVDRFLPWRRSRTLALALVYTAFIALLAITGVLVGRQVAQEATNLATEFPKMVEELERSLSQPGPAVLGPVKSHLIQEIHSHAANIGSALVTVLKTLTSHISSVLTSVITVVLVPVLGFFFLKDGRRLLDGALSLIQPGRKKMWEEIISDVHQLLGQYIRALVLLSLATFAAYSLFLLAIGAPYAALLGAIAAPLEFIPVFGPLTAAILILAVSITTGFGHAFTIVVFLSFYRIFQDYILTPELMSAQMRMHPVLVIFGVLAGEQVAGVPGIFLSIPVMAALRIIVIRIRRAQSAAGPPPTPGL